MIRSIALPMTLAAQLVLGYAGSRHLRRPDRLRRAARTHGIVRRAWITKPGVVAIGLGETLVCVCGIAAVLNPAAQRLLAPTAIVTALLYGVFTGYLALLYRRHAGTPCGCLGDDAPVGPAALTRSALFTLSAGAAIVVQAPAAAADRVFVLVLASGLAVLAVVGVRLVDGIRELAAT